MLMKFLTKTHVIAENQYGFVEGRSTEDTALKLLLSILMGIK